MICFALFATFIAFGIIVSVLLGRAGDGVGRVYFADLVGAGVGCLLAVPLISRLGPPAVIIARRARSSPWSAWRTSPPTSVLFVLASCSVLLLSSVSSAEARCRTSGSRTRSSAARSALYSDWGPVFRVDVLGFGDANVYLLAHDGTFGSGIHQFNGDVVDPRPVRDRSAGERRSRCSASRRATS